MTTELIPEATTAATSSADTTSSPPEQGAPAGRRGFFRSCAKGAGFAAIPFVAVLMLDRFNLMSESFTTHFYTAQAQALIHGHWDMPRVSLEFEGFQHGSRWYMYYGPFPALLRLPLAHFAPGISDRMTQLAILFATALALVCAARILWGVRLLLRADRAVTKQERLWAAIFVFVIGAGSAMLFLASQAWVYHEAEAWGAALALASFDALLVWLRRPSRGALVAAAAFAWASVLSRGSVGFGPIAALGLVAVVVAFPRLRSIAGVNVDVARSRAIGLAVAAFVPLASYCYVNNAKFGNPFVFPTASQSMSQINPGRKYFLAHSGGSYFSLKFVPSTLVQYFRPDALRLTTLLPFIDFPHSPHAIGGVVFDTLEPSSSIPSSMPFLFVLACIGLFAAFRPWRHRDGDHAPTLSGLRVPLVGAAIGAVSVLPFGYIAQRYLSDFVPLLVLAGAAGLQVALRWSDDRADAEPPATEPNRPRRRRRVVWSVLAVLAALSVLVNVALAVAYHYTTDWDPQEVSGPFIAAQYRLHNLVPGTSAPHVLHGAVLPDSPAPRGTVFVVGNCEGVYWSPGNIRELAWGPWSGVALSRAAGEYRLRMTFRHVNAQKVEPVVVQGASGQVQKIVAIVQSNNTVAFGFASEGHKDVHTTPDNHGYFTGPTIVHFVPGRTYNVNVIMDHNNGHVSVIWGSRIAFRFVQFTLTPEQLGTFVFPTHQISIGRNSVDNTTTPTFDGTIVEDPLGRPSLCNVLGGN
ncbi:MAG TPA: hypothetical protein VGO03_21040 [Acidimicrobiia bacterium]|jgi:hypothetical protein